MRELAELWRELWVERRRLTLVVLGLVWGTLGLTVLLAFGDGFHAAMGRSLAASGDAMLRLWGGATTRAFGGLPPGRPIPLEPDDVARVAQVPGVQLVSAEFHQEARAVAGGRVQNARVLGVDPDYIAVRGIVLADGGRFLSAADCGERRRVAVLGDKLARDLFGDPRKALGGTLLLWDAPFTVVGLLAPRTTLMNYDGDDDWKAIVPAPTMRAMRGLRRVSYVLARCAEPGDSKAVLAAIRRRLAASHAYDPRDEDAVACQDHAAMAGQIRGIVVGTRVFLFIVGVLGLLVAAIGVANMMFVTVEERVHEIGLRLAVGASPAQVRARHLLESVCVVAAGGGLGLLASALLLFAVNSVPMPPEAKAYLGEPLLHAGTALGIAGMLGACAGIAGWHPAARAAAVQPVEALRDE
jgi:putative ABC transport system permease protein